MSFINKRFLTSPIGLCVVVSIYLVLIFNRRFWGRAVQYFHHDYVLLSVILIIMISLFIALNVAFSIKYLLKIWLIMMVCIGAVASWFTDQFGTIIDYQMLVNVMETTGSEAGHLLTFNFIAYLVATVAFPSLIIVWTRLEYRSMISTVWRNLLVIILALGLAGSLSMLQARSLLSILREHNDLMRIVNPLAPLANMVKYVMREHVTIEPEFQTIGLDARATRPIEAQTRPRVIIMVIGEAARAENFSLQDYRRKTNPQLQARDVAYFGNVSSCGTATAQSVPCMFSPVPKAQFNRRQAAFMSSLPDILHQAGIKVEWWENNSDSKAVAKRIDQIIFYGRDEASFCLEGECLDGIMLEPLEKWLDGISGDSMLFIHQMGSHGPAYFKRYTEEFRQFLPDCRGVEFSRCSNEEIVNAYDNSLLYTDDFLSQIIDQLAARSDRIEAGLIYMSDHGESLGENGLYLHGIPYALAPSQQTHIPFVLWFSQTLKQSLMLDLACLTSQAKTPPLSHDNLFSSLLGIMEVETSVKDPDLDIFTPCRTGRER